MTDCYPGQNVWRFQFCGGVLRKPEKARISEINCVPAPLIAQRTARAVGRGARHRLNENSNVSDPNGRYPFYFYFSTQRNLLMQRMGQSIP